MTKLASTYARSTGLLLDQPSIMEAFYPQPHDRYITLQTGSKQGAKMYTYWLEVVSLLKPMLDANRIGIVLLGGNDDPMVNGTHDLRGKTTYLQSAFILKRALCHMGTDSWLAHLAGAFHRPLVALYGSTDPSAHGPYWCDVSKTVLLVSHRNGGRPTFVQQEVPKTIDLIPPEQVANAVLRLLGIGEQFPFSTLSIGPLYSHTLLELVPNTVPAPSFLPDLPITVRMDHEHNMDVLVQVLQTGRKIHIVTKAPIDLGLLQQARPSILTYSHELGEVEVGYADSIRALFAANHAFYTRETDEKKIADIRFRYFDHVTVGVQRDPTRDDWIGSVLTYTNRPDTPENRLDIVGQLAQNGRVRFKTNKYILSGGKVAISYAHLAAGQFIDSLAANTADLIDDPALWRDQQHMLCTLHPTP
jgi:hypothetical protein